MQTRQKLRARITNEAVIGGVIGRVDAPQVPILGRYDDHGQLQIAGRITDLSPTAQTAAGAALRHHAGPGHPRAATLPRSHWGRRPAQPLIYTRVHPDVVAELSVDPAAARPRWRHPARLVRLRPDLHADDLNLAVTAPPALNTSPHATSG